MLSVPLSPLQMRVWLVDAVRQARKVGLAPHDDFRDELRRELERAETPEARHAAVAAAIKRHRENFSDWVI